MFLIEDSFDFRNTNRQLVKKKHLNKKVFPMKAHQPDITYITEAFKIDRKYTFYFDKLKDNRSTYILDERKIYKQECIPVGCVPSPSVAISEVGHGGCLRGCYTTREDTPKADTLLGRHPLPHCMLRYTPPAPLHPGIHPPMDRRNSTCLWKHYLPVTTVAGGKYYFYSFDISDLGTHT